MRKSNADALGNDAPARAGDAQHTARYAHVDARNLQSIRHEDLRPKDWAWRARSPVRVHTCNKRLLKRSEAGLLARCTLLSAPEQVGSIAARFKTANHGRLT